MYETCGKLFILSSDLSRHESVHPEGEPPGCKDVEKASATPLDAGVTAISSLMLSRIVGKLSQT